MDYPYEPEDENCIERDVQEILYDLFLEASCDKKYIVEGNMQIPLSGIMPYVSEFCSSIDKLKFVPIY